MPAKPPAKIHWWYERLADAMIASPQKTLTMLAQEFDVSLAWLSVIKNSDVFVEYWQRRSADATKSVLHSLHAKAAAAAEMSLDIINGKLEREGDALPIAVLLEITDVSMKRFGYAGDKASPGPAVNVNLNVGVARPEELETARRLMRQRAAEPLQIEANDASAASEVEVA